MEIPTIEQALDEITNQHEKMLEIMLLKHGFDREYIKQHSEEFYYEESMSGDVAIYYHNDKEIFRVVRKYENNKIIMEFVDH